MDTGMSDETVGKVWGWMWQWMFLRRGAVCIEEWKALCGGWGICFKSEEKYWEWRSLWDTLADRKEEFRKSSAESTDARSLEMLSREVEKLEVKLRKLRQKAIERGRWRWIRSRIIGDL